jgi:hypothetical protein
MLSDSPQSACVGDLGWIGMKFSSSSTLIHPNTCGLMRIRLHPNNDLKVLLHSYSISYHVTDQISALQVYLDHYTLELSIFFKKNVGNNWLVLHSTITAIIISKPI